MEASLLSGGAAEEKLAEAAEAIGFHAGAVETAERETGNNGSCGRVLLRGDRGGAGIIIIVERARIRLETGLRFLGGQATAPAITIADLFHRSGKTRLIGRRQQRAGIEKARRRSVALVSVAGERRIVLIVNASERAPAIERVVVVIDRLGAGASAAFDVRDHAATPSEIQPPATLLFHLIEMAVPVIRKSGEKTMGIKNLPGLIAPIGIFYEMDGTAIGAMEPEL